MHSLPWHYIVRDSFTLRTLLPKELGIIVSSEYIGKADNYVLPWVRTPPTSSLTAVLIFKYVQVGTEIKLSVLPFFCIPV
jgi:hypothetical protein